ncbi:hypothetical protein ACQ5SK_27100 [Bradyrhizobium japonicum]
MDTVKPAVRSMIMASVGQKDTGPEVLLRKALHRRGLRYKLHDRALPGSPDLVFPRFEAVVFVHGCYLALTWLLSLDNAQIPQSVLDSQVRGEQST